MNQEQQTVIQECAALSMAGQITFGEVVARLLHVGIERYHADYCRAEITYYASEGASLVVPLRDHAHPIAAAFSAAAVEASVRQSQRGEITFPQFIRQTCAAGCVGYFVQLTGKRVQYFGRNGEIHTELFPTRAGT